ncbi:hypothetical protein C440_02693 [Haloferax mucosum ATCC BAA-1512]|uniref:Uncharacterized protein n=1 Tax=Haloferax mucosum ATCC BAA-1512 TaxID=662479 RepID=M0IN23_9EURY|nr:hypothetical protein [Haloferax mucosum]ELZ98120.1 hypothetical protein C440_02693 [Haloferax mucosum ATCC BAA-1512]
MRHKTIALAVAALVAFGASGAVAASITMDSPAVTALQSASDAPSSESHTVAVIDPHDRLTSSEVETAWEITQTNETVRSHFDGESSLHYQIEAEADELQVYVAKNDTAPPRVQAVVALDTQSVSAVNEIETVVAADGKATGRIAPQGQDGGAFESGEEVTLRTVPETGASTDETDREIPPGETFNATVTDDEFRVNNESSGE